MTASPRPLADRLRPRSLAEIVGQEALIGPDGALTRMLATRSLGSLIFWGPPGTGKTTVARLLAKETDLEFQQISAIHSGVADLKRIFEEARGRRETGQGTLLFVDEIHRFNRAQQDSFLPVMEDGTVTLVGATTENPSFELNAALLSARACSSSSRSTPRRSQRSSFAPRRRRSGRCRSTRKRGGADSACRRRRTRGLTLAEEVWRAAREGETFDATRLMEIVQRRAPIYDKSQDGHYNLISALHKSVRGSDPQAALYYLARMLDAGEDPMYLARRMIRMAVEDIGMADHNALVVANAAKEAYHMLGSPEGELALAEACVYLAVAPKSNALYTAFSAAKRSAKEHGSLAPPKHILNAPTKLMKAEGYAAGYEYDHNAEDAFSGQNYFPDEMAREEFYRRPSAATKSASPSA